MFEKRFFNLFKSISKFILPYFYKMMLKLKLSRRVINYLENESYFSNKYQDFTNIITDMLQQKKIVALDVGAQGGFNSDNFFPAKYNNFFKYILVEPINGDSNKIKRDEIIITKGLWSKEEKKDLYIIERRPGSSSMFKPVEKKFDIHNIKLKDYKNFEITNTLEVDCNTINNLLKKEDQKYLDYLKIDTQGAELNILKGLGAYRPLIIKIEAHIYSMYEGVPSWDKLLNYLYDLNYIAIDWKGIGGHNTRIPAEIDMIFIPNFDTKEGEELIKLNKEKFMSLLLIFGQINILKVIMKRINLHNKEIDKIQDFYFN